MPRTLYWSIMAMARSSASALPSVFVTRRMWPFLHASSWAPWTIWPAKGVEAMESATRPMKGLVPLTRVLARALGRYPSSSTARSTRRRASWPILAPAFRLMTCDTVVTDTPARSATCFIVTLWSPPPLMRMTPHPFVEPLSRP